MRNAPLAIVGVLVALGAGYFGAAARDGQPRAGPARPSTDDTRLWATSHGIRARARNISFCARPNGEPVALACGPGLRSRAPRVRRLPVHARSRVELRFGAPVERLFVSFRRATPEGRLVELTHPAPLSASPDPRRWTLHVAPGEPSLLGHGTVVGLLAIYRDPVRIDLAGRPSAPFEDATATFDLALRKHVHR